MARAWQTLETVDTAAGALSLRRRGERDLLIALAARVLMTSAAHRSEDRLGEVACAGLAGLAAPRVLIGGLGMGYTLRAALDALPAGARVVVAELEPAVVRWCRSWLAPLTRAAASDPRVELRVADVAHVIEAAAGQGAFHAIALDLSLGPRGDRAEARHPIYGDRALAAAARALLPGAALAVWSETEAPGFERRLGSAGFSVERVRAGRGGRRHVVYLARRAATDSGAATRSRAARRPR